MTKGLFNIEHFSLYTENPLSLSERTEYAVQVQDTSSKKTQSSLQVGRPQIKGITDTAVRRASIDDLFKAAEAREKQITQTKTVSKPVLLVDTLQFQGSTTREYSDFIPSYKKNQEYNGTNLNYNFLANIPDKSYHLNYERFIGKTDTAVKAYVSVPAINNEPIITGFEGKQKLTQPTGWLVVLSIFALVLFSRGKVLYNKYLYQIIEAIYNYQISIRLLKDKNVLFRSLSYSLQVLFSLNVGLLIFYFLDYNSYRQISEHTIISILVYSFSIFFIFQIKAMVCMFLGYSFNVQDDFTELLHNVSIYNKAIGLFLLPIVITFPFLQDKLKPVVLYAGIIITGLLLIMFLYRGLQIISRKRVSYFFLILYLCGVEILPLALIIKASNTII